MNIRRYFAVLFTLCLMAVGASAFAQSKTTSGSTKHKVVIQVSDADPKKWQLALNNAQNIQDDLGKNQVEIEIVAYGPGLGMLKLDSAVAGGVAEAIGNGVEVAACENTMRHQKIPKGDIISKVSFVKAGVVELMNKQEMGYSYIRP